MATTPASPGGGASAPPLTISTATSNVSSVDTGILAAMTPSSLSAGAVANTAETVEKEGILRKRSGRMHRWTSRYFILTATKISYKVKADATALKGTFDLAPGSIVTGWYPRMALLSNDFDWCAMC
jgi:hypothetical protein